jgi:hypothetical protein
MNKSPFLIQAHFSSPLYPERSFAYGVMNRFNLPKPITHGFHMLLTRWVYFDLLESKK